MKRTHPISAEVLDQLERSFAYRLVEWLEREIANADADERQSPTAGASSYYYRGRAQALSNVRAYADAYLRRSYETEEVEVPA